MSSRAQGCTATRFELEAFWGRFDAIFCINLNTRTDRRQESQACFDALHIPARYWTVSKHPHSPEIGAWESHQNVMREAFQTGCRNCLIFEDDVAQMNPLTVDMLQDLHRFMDRYDDEYDILFLGPYPDIWSFQTQPCMDFVHVHQIHGYLGHAYVVSRRFMEKMYHVPHSLLNLPVDMLYVHNVHSYAVYPPIFYQTDSPSDISSAPRWTDTIRQGFVAWKNWYSYYVNVPLAYVCLWVTVLLLLLMFVALCWSSATVVPRAVAGASYASNLALPS